MAKIAIFTKIQNVACDAPAHYATRRFSSAIIAAPMVGKWIEFGKSIQLLTDESWASIRHRLRPRPVQSNVRVLRPEDSGILNPIGYHVPPINFPIADQRSVMISYKHSETINRKVRVTRFVGE